MYLYHFYINIVIEETADTLLRALFKKHCGMDISKLFVWKNNAQLLMRFVFMLDPVVTPACTVNEIDGHVIWKP